MDALLYLITELTRRLSNTVITGTVKSFDKGKVVADIGFETHEIDVGFHGGEGADWAPYKKGQQITLLCPGGDLANAVIIASGFHDDNPAPSDSADEDLRARRGEKGKAKQLRTTKDGAFLENEEAKTFARAGKDMAELAHGDGAAVRARKDKVVHLKVGALDKLKIVIGDQAFQIRPEALLPVNLDT